MSLTLTDLRRIAADVARQQDPALDVVAAMPAEGDAAYTEVMFTVTGCRHEPCQLVVGLSRNSSEPDCRRAVEDRLRQHLAETNKM